MSDDELERDLCALFQPASAPPEFRDRLKAELLQGGDRAVPTETDRRPRLVAAWWVHRGRQPLAALGAHPRAAAVVSGLLAAAALLLSVALHGDLGPNKIFQGLGLPPVRPTATASATASATARPTTTPTAAPIVVAPVPSPTPTAPPATATPRPTATHVPHAAPTRAPATPTRVPTVPAYPAVPPSRRSGHAATPVGVPAPAPTRRHLVVPTATASATATPRPTAVPTNTPVPTVPPTPAPTAVPVVPTAAPVPPTATPIVPTSTPALPTATPVVPSVTPVPATMTHVHRAPTAAPHSARRHKGARSILSSLLAHLRSLLTPVAMPTASPRPSATPAPRATARATARPRVANTPRPTLAPSATPMPRPTDTPTATPRPRPTSTPRPTPAPTATETPWPTATPRPRPTATPGPRPTATPRPTSTPRPRATATVRPTATATASATPQPSPTQQRDLTIPLAQPQLPLPAPNNGLLASPLGQTTGITQVNAITFSVPTAWSLPQVPATLPVYPLDRRPVTVADASAVTRRLDVDGLLMAPQPAGDGSVIATVMLSDNPYTLTVYSGYGGPWFTLQSIYPGPGYLSAARLPAVAGAWLSAHGLAQPDLQALPVGAGAGGISYVQSIDGLPLLARGAVHLDFDGSGALLDLRYEYIALPSPELYTAQPPALAADAAVEQPEDDLYAGPDLSTYTSAAAISTMSVAYVGVRGVKTDYLEPIYLVSGTAATRSGPQPFTVYLPALQ